MIVQSDARQQASIVSAHQQRSRKMTLQEIPADQRARKG
jgi:hypothetical protein